MVPTLFFYQLVLIVLVWLCFMLPWTWPSDPATCLITPTPTPPVPKRKLSASVSANPLRASPPSLLATPVSTRAISA